MKSLLGALHDPDVLVKLQLCLTNLGSHPEENLLGPWAKQQIDVLETFASYVVELAAAHSWSQALYTQCFPYVFAGVHHPCPGERHAAMRHMRSIWESVIRAEGWQQDKTLPASTKRALKQLMQDLIWNEGQVAREVYATCSQCAWDVTNDEVREFSYILFANLATTKFHLEDCFGHLADLTKRFAKHSKMTKRLS